MQKENLIEIFKYIELMKTVAFNVLISYELENSDIVSLMINR